MPGARLVAALLCACLPLWIYCAPAHSQDPQPRANVQRTDEPISIDEKRRQTNDITVNLVVSDISCTCARFAEDIRNVVNNLRPDGLRVLPVIGVGGLQNLNDVLFLNGIDMGVVDEDDARLLKRRDPQLYANLEQRVQYITKLYNSEFQVVARNNIRSFDDLRGKKVNFDLKDSQTEVTADVIFSALHLDVQRSYYDNDEAISKLLDGELSAMIILTGAPQAALAKLTSADGVHFLPLDQKSLPNHDLQPVFDNYMPANLTSEEYPELIESGTIVPTIASRALLVAHAWPENSVRYNRIARFVDAFFSKIDQFHDRARHPKWKEINLAADIPGWTRFKPAADWIAQHRPAAEARGQADDANGLHADRRALFAEFLDDYTATRRNKLTLADQEELFVKFDEFVRKKAREQR